MVDAFVAGDGVDQPPPRLVAIHELLPRHVAVVERHDAGIAVELAVDGKSRPQPLMHRAEIAHGVPDGFGGRVDGNVLANRGHGLSWSVFPSW